MPPLSISFNLPFDEAIKQAKSRGVMLPEAYYAQPAEYRRITQSISGMANLDQIQKVINSLNQHVAEGGTLHSFQQAVDEMNVGLTRGHLDLIFRNGVQNAYNAGHWRNFEEFKDTRPYLMYDAVNDSRTRLSHRVLDNMIKPVDDPFWYTHSPPLGHRCRCRLLSLSTSQAKDRGGVTANTDPLGVPDKGFGGKPAQLGETLKNVEAEKLGQASPTIVKAWETRKIKGMNTGQLWDVKGNLDDCLSLMFSAFAADAPACLKADPNQNTWVDHNLPDLRELKKTHATIAPAMLQAGNDADEALQILRGALGLSEVESVNVKTPMREIQIADWALGHIVEKRNDMRERYANFIIPTLENPLEVWKTQYEDGFRERYIKLFEDKYDLFVVVRVNQDGSLLWNVMQRKTVKMNDARMGEILWKSY